LYRVPDNFGGLGRVREIHALPSHHEDFPRRPIYVVSLETQEKSIKIKREINHYSIRNQSILQAKIINTTPKSRQLRSSKIVFFATKQ
jgi:hypothetical protein